MRILITGMLGFIGHHVLEHFLHETNWEFVGLDRIDATSTLERLRHIKGWPDLAKRVSFVWHDLRAPINSSVSNQIGDVHVVLHLAASTHVDRSITEPLLFVYDNVVGTANLLDWWRVQPGARDGFFINFGSDEIFGPARPGEAFKEDARYNSANPYSAAKAGAEELACAFSNTYKLHIAATHGMNVFGERQHPEKFIPMTIAKVLRGETVIIHGEAGLSGSRFYLHADNVARALKFLIQSLYGNPGAPRFSKWNIVGEKEVTNLELAQRIAFIAGVPLKYDIVDFHKSRPGHDMRYALDGGKLREAGFEFPETFDQSLERTVRWYLEHREWLAG
jgi:dTDP-glucose 4,6-dehydratase